VLAEILGRLGGDNTGEPLSGRWDKLRDLSAGGEGVLVP
jgi:hypothetical protein